MRNPQAQLIDLRERLQACGEGVSAQAESFHRERAGLLDELAGALSWRGLLGRGQSAVRLTARVAGLCARAEGLATLFARLGQVEQALAAAAVWLGQSAAPKLRAAGALPERLGRLGAEAGRLGRQVATDDDLMVDLRRCESLLAEAARLAEALELWCGAEETLGRLRASPRTAALEASLPDLGERLCRLGPTPEWVTELKALVGPLAQLMQRAEPREIGDTEKIIKALPRWARALGESGDAGEALAERFMARRRDWPGEDDRTFRELFEQARVLEQGLVERAAAVRREGAADLEARCGLFAELLGSDAGLEALAAELRGWTPGDPREHEDWCLRLREANAAFQNRVKRAESALLAALGASLDECRQRFATLDALPRPAAQDGDLARLRERFATLDRTPRGFEAETLLGQVGEARALRDALDDLAVLIRREQADLARAAVDLKARAGWLAERARGLGIGLPPAPESDPAPGCEPGPGSAPAPDARRAPAPEGTADLARVRQGLEAQAVWLSAAEVDFARAAVAAGDAAEAEAQRLLALIAPERVRAAGLGAVVPSADPGDLAAVAAGLEARRERLAAARELAAALERDLGVLARDLHRGLAALDPERLGHHDRAECEAVLRQLAGWVSQSPNEHPNEVPADLAGRLAARLELIENARHLERRIAAAARYLEERRADLEERLRRVNARLLHLHCPDLYARVEALVRTPRATRWPRGAEAAQLAEAGRLLALLERTAGRLAARALEDTLAALQRRVLRGVDAPDALARTLLAELRALPPEQPPPAGLRRRLADWTSAAGEGGA